ncbi:GNAT family N-acetyltransferase [Bradyrhizobium sp. AUGA SZCCT0431]|uniref:GNAT family N-acetyltransferase n=1 Tax=Bradyrhizobium sp. AUGA SZCCT0431 TaxID=2807674 RepID=UPI001BA8CCE1|nr:GNAT family N-acetyltransferase [Bradyrhizobium sp. AUGA SZCCT0431]MBR1142134.1 GNAT family N-acetyltransferase [Bradyrhizobium sp. AUGA SZCCT0431]
MNSIEWLHSSINANCNSPALAPMLQGEVLDVATTFVATAAAAVFEIVRLRTGKSVVIRLLEPDDREALQAYFEALSPAARRNRFTGASHGPSDRELDLLFRSSADNRFAVVAVMTVNGVETIVAEACYAFDRATGGLEFGVSVHDDHRGCNIGSALLSNLERLAAAFGARHIFGDTLRTNNEMQALARKAGFAFVNMPGNWCERRMVKPCLAALGTMLGGVMPGFGAAGKLSVA